ncbi:uncharacterized protein MONOS_15319 [Monocercomonoides exilis]|uniref:uncharacterized protein n=1 Tax=Monocercomonoides exilis TaxID=2049356 RepID=UPI00355A303F|nr:hypothetical protein MONOS_15319 [Monocercomonoides exilis]|eukprot:MONOS_15319.1-p1 / transcript=MONOS_15319.1 / gene=MONOS_15319 / organism=Monocercomonoides_exilis_PA203 / gene_product=unspecified product / transcript_product=unspecified product / location=Mono_scaffold01197:11294-12285(+) / protein_length=277 / sequence_SO=supercontig / SO=protein_coding / is_pseudo=false
MMKQMKKDDEVFPESEWLSPWCEFGNRGGGGGREGRRSRGREGGSDRGISKGGGDGSGGGGRGGTVVRERSEGREERDKEELQYEQMRLLKKAGLVFIGREVSEIGILGSKVPGSDSIRLIHSTSEHPFALSAFSASVSSSSSSSSSFIEPLSDANSTFPPLNPPRFVVVQNPLRSLSNVTPSNTHKSIKSYREDYNGNDYKSTHPAEKPEILQISEEAKEDVDIAAASSGGGAGVAVSDIVIQPQLSFTPLSDSLVVFTQFEVHENTYQHKQGDC